MNRSPAEASAYAKASADQVTHRDPP